MSFTFECTFHVSPRMNGLFPLDSQNSLIIKHLTLCYNCLFLKAISITGPGVGKLQLMGQILPAACFCK